MFKPTLIFLAIFLWGQQGEQPPREDQNAPCTTICAPAGAKGVKVPEGATRVNCAGTETCTKGQGCDADHVAGCSTYCKRKCCVCCGI